MNHTTAPGYPGLYRALSMSRALSACAAVALLQAPALAQPAAGSGSGLEEIIVVSSRIPLPLRRIGTSVTTLDAADISLRGNLTLTDVLRQFPAVAVGNSGGAGQTTALRIRGEEGFRTLTLMDGLRLSDPSAPQVGPQFDHLLSSGIARVEILRGPQGLGYGADAGGVVDLSSRRGSDGLQGTLEAQSGAFGTQQLAASAGGAGRGADFFVSAARLRSAGFNSLAADTVFADADGYRNDTLHLRGGMELGSRWRLDAVHRRVAGATRHDHCFSPGSDGHDCLTTYAQQGSRLALAWRGDALSQTLSWNRTDTDRDGFAGGAFSYGARGVLERWEYNGHASTLPGLDLAFGADHESARNNGEGRANRGAWLELLGDFSDALQVSAGLRHDSNDDFGSNTSHRLSGAWLHTLASAATLKFKGSIGSGFRAPSPYEVQYNRSPWAYAPAAQVTLRQESSRGWEAGVEYLRGTTLKLEAVYFDQQVEDAIEFDLSGWSGYLQESGSSVSQGVEMSAELVLGPHWRLNGNFTWNDTTRPNGLPRLRRPRQLLNAGLSWQGLEQQRLSVNAFVRAAHDSRDESGGMAVAVPGFAVLDLSAGFRVSPALQLFARVENALDEDYQEVYGYRTAGRAAYLGFRMGYGTP